MIHYRFYTDWNLHHLGTTGQSSLLQIVEYGMALGERNAPGSNLDLPALFDLRRTELNSDTSADIKKAIRLRKTLRENTGNNPCAYVVGDLGSYGMMRMYGIYAELEGLRKEDLTLVTEDLDEAIEWLIGYLDLPTPEEEDRVRRTLSSIPALTH